MSRFAILLLLAGSISSAQTPSQLNSLHLQRAAKDISDGKLDQAERELQPVLHSVPGEYRALDLLGVVRALQRDQTKAEELFHQAIQKRPDFAPGHAHLGLLYLQLGRTQDAARELRQALLLDPSRSDAARALAHILEEQAKAAAAAEDWNNALSSLGEARKYAPENADVEFEFGMAALKLSLEEDAIAAFRKTLELRNDDALALYNLGRAYMALSKFDEARREFARYVELRPQDPSGHCALGMTLAALQRSNEAREQFERSIALDPTQTESYYRLGLMDLDAGEYGVATRNLRHVLEREPKNTGALTALGKLKFEQKSYPEAVALLQQAISNDSAAREAHYYFGLALARLGRAEDSDKELQIATRLQQEQAQQRRTVKILVPERSSDLEK